MELDVEADFADIFEVRGWLRPGRGTLYEAAADDRTITFSYRGVDGLLQMSGVRFSAPPTEVGPRGAAWRFNLDASARVEFDWEIVSGDPRRRVANRRNIAQDGLRLDSEYLRWGHACSGWRTDVEAFNLMLERAVEDMHALSFRCDGYRVPAAGIPWALDGFRTRLDHHCLQTLPLNPAIATETLRFLAARQGEKHDEFTEEAPGKIMHELRRGEMARSGEIPHIPYYGTVDATPLWLVLLHETWRWTGDSALGAMSCCRPRSAPSTGSTASGMPTPTVSWSTADTRPEGSPIRDGRIPATAFRILTAASRVRRSRSSKSRATSTTPSSGSARSTRHSAGRTTPRGLPWRPNACAKTIDDRFWMEEMGTYALALDGAKQRIPTVTTNAGHLLWSRVPSNARAERMATRLFQPDMYSGWGLRTLSSSHPVFNPMSYHNGSVWPHDNALIALGLGFYGRHSEASWILGALYDACSEMGSSRLPELYCGMQRGNGMRPVRYPVSCSPQAWASGAFFMVLQGTLGLLPAASEGVLHVRTPALPDFLRELTITRLRVGGSSISLQFRRHRDRTLVNLLEAEGDPLRVQINL